MTRARSLSAVLLAVVVAPAALAAPAAAAVSPYDSCADVAAATPGAADGTYSITVFGQTLDVWCADMAGAPVEYLTVGAGNTSTVGDGGAWWWDGDDAVTTYSRVRLLLPASPSEPFSVLRTDRTFSTSTGDAANDSVTWVAYAGGGNCGGNLGRAEVDLTGTPFDVAAAEFAYYGWDASGNVAQPGPQRLSMWVSGWCSSVGPVDPTPTVAWENSHPEVFPLIWNGAVAPVVTAPADSTVASGGTATFAASATGDPSTVQWQTSVDGETWTDVPGATTGTLELAGVEHADSGLQVRAVFTNAEGSVPTAAATLTVLAAAPSYVAGPADAAVTSGDDAAFAVTVEGDPTPTVQWEWSADGETWVLIDGATGTELVLAEVTTADDGLLVRAVATNAGGAVASEPALLTVAPLAPVLTVTPEPVTVDEGGDATFSVAATGDPAPTFQWETSADGTTWTPVVGATDATFTLSDVAATADGLQVRVVATNEGGTVTSAIVTLTVVAAPAAPTTPATPGAGPDLAVTGSEPTAMLSLSALLLVAGAAAVVVARRRLAPVRIEH